MYEKNARKHEDADLSTIIASIKEFGMCDAIGIWSDKNIIVEGHGRYMGGRGARFGVSEKGNKYGSQYKTVLEVENIKFVTSNGKNYEALMETMTPGRIYVQVGGDDLLRVVLFGENLMRNKVLEKDRRTGEWHAHYGYEHREYSENQHDELTDSDKHRVKL